MSSWRRRAAITLVRWSALLLPTERKEWVAAMRAETDAIDEDRAALDFALGCLWTSIKERICKVKFVTSVLNIGIPAGLFALAAIAVHLSGHHDGADTQVGTVFGLLFVLFTIGAALFLAGGAKAFARFAGMLIPAYLVLLLFLHSAKGMATDSPVASLYRALAIEGVAIWTTLLLVAVFVPRAIQRFVDQERR